MGLIIGVDGGGTKSTYSVFDTDNGHTTEFVGCSINFYSIGNDKAVKAFEDVILKINKKFNKNIDSICIGNAALGIGEEMSPDHQFSKTVSKYTSNSRIVSDLYIGLKGVDKTPAIFLISGTGSMGIAESEKGEFYTIGGWGYLLGDQGSGYYIGINGIREALKASDGVTGKSLLIESLLDYFKISNVGEVIDIVYNKKVENKVIANFAVEVHKAFAENDLAAMKIIHNSIDYLSKCVLVLHEKLNKAEAKLAVYGGNFQRSEKFFNLFKERVCACTDKIEIGFPGFIPVEAALILAGKEIGLDLTKYIKQ